MVACGVIVFVRSSQFVCAVNVVEDADAGSSCESGSVSSSDDDVSTVHLSWPDYFAAMVDMDEKGTVGRLVFFALLPLTSLMWFSIPHVVRSAHAIVFGTIDCGL